MTTYTYTTTNTLQAAINRRATRHASPRIPSGAAGSIRVNDTWALVLGGTVSHFIRVSTEDGPDNLGRGSLQLALDLAPGATCYIVTRGPSAYILDGVGAQYLRRYVRPVR